MRRSISAFTVIELLVVIVVITILSAITIVIYDSVRTDGLNAERVSDMNQLQKALEAYRIKNGTYPSHTASPAACRPTGWEDSNLCPDSFLAPLEPYLGTKSPVDPSNSSTNRYQYHLYAAGNSGCDTSKGQFYVLQVIGPSGEPTIESSPGWSCPSRDWGAGSNVRWTAGSFTLM